MISSSFLLAASMLALSIMLLLVWVLAFQALVGLLGLHMPAWSALSLWVIVALIGKKIGGSK